jgi:hypothetical protein
MQIVRGVLAVVAVVVLGAVPLSAAQSDLGIVKRISTPASGIYPTSFEVIVTNYGPDAAGAITVTDTLSPGSVFELFLFGGMTPGPWVCTFTPPSQSTSVSCTHPGPIPAGNSVILPLHVYSPPGRSENCARASHAAANSDPDTTNNEDCTCTDVKRCRNVSIDLSTGTRNGQTLNIGESDDDWMVVGTPSGIGTNAPAKVVGEYHAGFVDAPPANWISATNPFAEAEGDYIYETSFRLSGERYGNCALRLEYASDNEVQFFLDGALIGQNLSTDSSAFTQLHSAASFVSTDAGTHTLRARVHNGGGPTSLLVRGSVQCSCSGFLDIYY